ncbi:MAG: YHS domain-containing (seleno)protein [Cyclobacteriaceae bacterium]
MKNSKSMITIVGVAVALLAAHTTLAQDKTEHYNLDDTKIALDGYSPVSYFEKGRAEKGSKQYKSKHEGVSYYFTNQAQKKIFEKNPSKYIPAYGGWCAFGVSVGGLFRADPEKFKIVDGQLLVFLNDIETDALKLWNQTPNGDRVNTKKAKANWVYFGKGQRPA